MKPSLFLCVLVIVLLANCKKYEEDPYKTIKSPVRRLIGDWILWNYTHNGQSVVDSLNARFGGKFNVLDLKMSYQKKSNNQYEMTFGGTGIPFYPHAGNFNKYRYITIVLNNGSVNDSIFKALLISPLDGTPNFTFGGNRSTWQVTKLYNNTMNMVMTTNKGEYKIHFYKQ